MRDSGRRFGRLLVVAVATTIAVAAPSEADSTDAIARLLAERFAQDAKASVSAGRTHKVEPAKPPAAADEQRMLEEIDMLERARAEADARREAPPASVPSESADASIGAEGREHQPARKAIESEANANAEPGAGDERGVAEEHRQIQEDELARMEAEREAEAERIDEALRKARAARAARDRDALDPPNGKLEPVRDGAPAMEPRDAPEEPQRPIQRTKYDASPMDARSDTRTADRVEDGSGRDRNATRVTVLMTMEPGNRGIRRHNKSADPLLCGETGCYIGASAATKADFLPRRRAFGPARTLGQRAGACRDSLGCVFRGVDLVAYPSALQPIDMRFLRHDRRQPQVLTAASDCHLTAGRLACTPIRGPDYVMWVVPESIAEAAGPVELQRVVDRGLHEGETAAIDRTRN